MQLVKHGTAILARNVVVARIDPTRALAVLISQGHSAPVARAVAFGGALTRENAIQLGKTVGLFTGGVALPGTVEQVAAMQVLALHNAGGR